MQYPASTGQVARVLGVTEPQLAETVRRGKVDPPPVIAGRRLWSPAHILQAAEALGCSPPSMLSGDAAAPDGGES